MDNFAPLKLPGEGKRVSVLGVPLSFGQSMAGVDLGPSAMRVAGLTRRIKKLGYEVKDLDDLKARGFRCVLCYPEPDDLIGI